MSTASVTQGTVLIVEDSDTYVSSSETSPETAVLPEIDDGSSDTVSVGDEIRFECTGGGVLRVETFDGRLVGIVPGRGAAVVVAEAGNQESETDFWRFQVLANEPADHIADPAETAAGNNTAIDAILVVLEDFGLVKAE